jgi:hypothetical protein
MGVSRRQPRQHPSHLCDVPRSTIPWCRHPAFPLKLVTPSACSALMIGASLAALSLAPAIFNNCIFRNCSFQRITLFASIENYEAWKNNPNVNWISIPPSPVDIEERRAIISPPAKQPTALAPTPDESSHEETPS